MGKKVVVFGDNIYVVVMIKILVWEMGIYVVLVGIYCKYDVDWFWVEVFEYCDEVLISEDNGAIVDVIVRIELVVIFGI